MNAASRRDVMRGGLAAAALVPLTGVSASANDDGALRGMWQRYIEATKIFAVASNTEDEASSDANREQMALVCPWTPLGPDQNCLCRHGASEESCQHISG